MSANKTLFQNFEQIDRFLSLANNDSTKISGVGKVNVNINDRKMEKTMKLDRVLYITDLRTNLLSVISVKNNRSWLYSKISKERCYCCENMIKH